MTMKAVVFGSYGGHEELRMVDIPMPQPAPREVRVRVVAAGLNPYDWHQYRGEPLIMRPSEGWRVREDRVLGADFAGIVDAVGAEVDSLAVGDRVMGETGRGALAEYVNCSESQCTKLDPGVALATAAALPMGGLTALQALRDYAEVKPGERVLIWGASGGVGHLAVQIARALGASAVDAVCSGRNRDMVRGIGADVVFDYTALGDTPGQQPTGPYDVILDTVCTRSLRQLRPLLSPVGRVVSVGAVANGRALGPARSLLGRVASAKVRGVSHSMMLAKVTPDDLAWLASQLADGGVTPVIARAYPLAKTAAACAELESGHVAGKLVVTVGAE
jgi:NADPH:quinone reductase-like Zn-dependent oxidoreductase